jgi:hypothetical protein
MAVRLSALRTGHVLLPRNIICLLLVLISTYFKIGWSGGKITVNPAKSSQITFTTRRIICPQVSINNFPIPIKQEVKYLGLNLDIKLTWQTHIKAKRRQLELKVKNMN